MALKLGTCVGPVAGGVVAYTSGSYIWVFWALFIVGVILLCGVGVFLPETARNMVGNGGNPLLYTSWQRFWMDLLGHRLKVKATTDIMEMSEQRSTATSCKRHPANYGFSNLIACFRIIFYKDTFLSLWIHGSFYTVDYSFVAAAPDIFKNVYHWDELQIGLSYLPRGIGIIIGSYFTGKLMDHNYRAIFKCGSVTYTITI
ncbi:hypothetical protein GQ44DRAFT_729631 [Phaeosphaeriaceae sp. PMI808]|nr:hypothetical protein GQ44DRAFT_729631 [Phaeosphaeriaceae sp. PMI808]